MLELMNYNDYQTQLNGPNRRYYTGRWEYYKEVINIIKCLNITKVLELGPGFIPIIKNATIMLNPLEDLFGRPNNDHAIFHDATRSPWPINDKEYDCLLLYRFGNI